MPFYLKPGRHNSPLAFGKRVMGDEKQETPPADQVIQLNNIASDVQLGKPSSKNESSRGWLDRFQDVLTVGGFAPGPIGAGIDILNTAISGGRSLHALATGDKDAAKQHGKNAVLYGLSSVPGAGDAFAAANLAKKGTQFVQRGSKAYKSMKALGKVEGALSGKNLLADARDHAQETFAKVQPKEKV
tara:strand:- start:777 stop:1337 length:561 start_codon:yes stop_codon:yes gene_type:complete